MDKGAVNALPTHVPNDNDDPGDQAGARRQPRSNAATGASAASIRALSAQLIGFYFRAPVKAFFRTRVDYMAYPKAINPRVQAGQSWSWHTSTVGLLGYAVKEHGWAFIPNQVLPPLVANVTVGAVLYTSYLQTLAILHEPSARSAKRSHPAPEPKHTFTAGFIAGGIQSLVAAPLDAIQVRFKTSELLEGRYRTMWHYAISKLKSIGPQGIFAGWSLALVKDAWGCALFFSTFEFVKAQAFYSFLTRWYGHERYSALARPAAQSFRNAGGRSQEEGPVIRPHYLIEPSFILLAGVTASITQNMVQHPLTEIQNAHFGRLESLDYAAQLQCRRVSVFRLYYHAYAETFEQCRQLARKAGGWRVWLYRGFVRSTVRQVPSTSAGLVVFETVRRKYSDYADAVRLRKDGYDILLA